MDERVDFLCRLSVEIMRATFAGWTMAHRANVRSNSNQGSVSASCLSGGKIENWLLRPRLKTLPHFQRQQTENNETKLADDKKRKPFESRIREAVTV